MSEKIIVEMGLVIGSIGKTGLKYKRTAQKAVLRDLLRHFFGTQSHEKGDRILLSEEVREGPLPKGSGPWF